MVIRVQMIRSDTRHPDRRRRHPAQAWCDVGGRRFEAHGLAPVYKLATLLWLHGHGGADFEVWDDRSPTGKPGGIAMRGRVRNWARLVNDKLSFDKDAPSNPDFTPVERDMIARAAGKTPSRPGEARTAATHPSDGSEHPQRQDDASAGVVGPHTSVAA